MKRLVLIFSCLLLALDLSSHPWKPSHYVIVDTDGGVDDIKAIFLLLASPDVRVLAITVSPGVLSAEKAYIKIKSLLNSCYHEGIPVGVNRSAGYRSENYKVAAEAVWGVESDLNPDAAPGHIKLIRETLSAEKTKIRFVCLGSMTTAYSALTEIPGFSKQVKDIVWSTSEAEDTESFNYRIDRNSSSGILKQEIPVRIVKNFSQNNVLYSRQMIDSIADIANVYAKKINEFLNSDLAKSHAFAFTGTDDLVPVFIHYPELFRCSTKDAVSDCVPSGMTDIRNSIIRILRGETIARNQVIKNIPADPSFYFDDIGPAAAGLIRMYGIDEWTSGVLANELHRHLGVYSIVGVKMGIRAREYFNTGVDEFRVFSSAGSEPPLSCMNDGLQVSTGATPGHGLLTVINDPVPAPSAEFTYLNHRIRIKLKPELAAKISSELKEINFIYGLDSNIYWEIVRKNSIKYWKELDRHDIFIIEEIE